VVVLVVVLLGLCVAPLLPSLLQVLLLLPWHHSAPLLLLLLLLLFQWVLLPLACCHLQCVPGVQQAGYRGPRRL
jgi:hypothetical protein